MVKTYKSNFCYMDNQLFFSSIYIDFFHRLFMTPLIIKSILIGEEIKNWLSM